MEGNRISEAASPPPRPRWIKVLAILVGIVVLVVIVMLLIGGEHGPGRHLPSGDSGTETAPARHSPPAGGH